ncbi:hypothetical protein PHYPSEUDO_005608 [Phytophthora pseudosyringae]|uniref:Telomeric single stranded DNA binding POT1/Cdc13 domain-containing protein n=1 Tax=Phytophthora pseudosyringae TaxID=221518 RepID=A0A8T1WC64_9STRA|nr:hypothetical protein PHYPSEUDO_005608 [Phytophthora pseudosyringae]
MELVGGDRVVSGSVKRAYPLQSLRAESSQRGELGIFGPGVGPCGPDASQLVAVVYRIRISGRGLVALEWEAGAETEERVQCIVVAERNVLKKTLERQPRLFNFPHSLSVEVEYEEPQRLPESDQLRYLPSKTIATRDLHSAAPTRQTLIQVQAPPRKKLNYGKRMLGKAKVTSPAYRYSPLSELVDGYADIYGVVVNMTLPKKTGGRDFCMTVSVTDESCPTREKAIQINIFYPTVAQMPKIKYVGDIIRFHKVKIQLFQDKIQGVSLPRATRHLVLRESESTKLEQLTYSETWTFEPSDEERTRKLIKWSQTSLAEDITLPHGCLHAPKLLAELKFAEGFIDLVVRVLHLDDRDEPIRLIVWDGSGNAAESDQALVCVLRDKGAVVPAYGLLKEVIMSSCWPVVREMGFVDRMFTHWCRFRNLAVGIDEPIPGAPIAPGRREILRFREVTSFVLMPEYAFDVQLRLSSLNGPTGVTNANRIPTRARTPAETQHPSPSQSPTTASLVEVTTVIPERIQKHVPVTSLREILSSPQTPRKFHFCARARSIWPTDFEKICKPKPGNRGEFMYSFALTVEEGNDSLNIIVYGKDAENFLHDIPPCDLGKSTSSKTLLEKRLTALLKSPNAFHWCIKAYSISLPPGRSAGPATAVRYRLFDTLLQCS